MPDTLGRIDDHDPRSRQHPYIPRRAVHPVSVRHAMNAPHVDQFYTSGCVGFSGTNLLNCGTAIRSRRRFHYIVNRLNSHVYLNNDDGLENYSGATQHDTFDWTYPPDDEGAGVLGLMKWWKANGIITGYDWCFTFGAFIAALQRQPVLVGTEWFTDMTNGPVNGLFARPTGESQGGHEYLATQIIWKTKVLGFENSWGENWGHGGRFYMRFEDFEPLLADGGDAVVPQLLTPTK